MRERIKMNPLLWKVISLVGLLMVKVGISRRRVGRKGEEGGVGKVKMEEEKWGKEEVRKGKVED